MQIQAIESFLMVYETQNMSRASERLYITQQCLSRQIKGIENELGVQLFIRQKTGMKPTEICRKLFPEFKKMMTSYESACQICSNQKNKNIQKLTIALANGMSNYIDISSLSLLVRNCVDHDLVIEERPAGECSKMLLSGEADMAFLLEPFDDTMLEHVLIRQDFGCIAMHKSHPLAKETRPVPFSALNGLKTVTGVKTSCAAEHFKRFCAQSNIYPQCVASVMNTTGFANSLSQGDIVVTILSYAIPQITNPDVVIRKVVDPVLMGKCHCCFRSDAEKKDLLRTLMFKIKENYAAV